MTDERLLIRVTEAAKLLAISRSKAYEMIAQKQIPSVRFGGSVRVPLKELRQMIADLTRKAGQ